MTRDQIVKLRAIHDTTGLRLDTASGLAGTFYGADGSTAAPVTALLDECERSLAKDAEITSLRAQLDEARRKAIDDVGRLRALLEEELVWHEERDKSLSKQPPFGEKGWRRADHQERIDVIRALLSESKT